MVKHRYHRAGERRASGRDIHEQWVDFHVQPRTDQERMQMAIDEYHETGDSSSIGKALHAIDPWKRPEYVDHIRNIGKVDVLKAAIPFFYFLHEDIAQELIERGEGAFVLRHTRHFQPFSEVVLRAALAQRLYAEITQAAYAFASISEDAAIEIIRAGQGTDLFVNRRNLPITRRIAEALIEQGLGRIVVGNSQTNDEYSTHLDCQLDKTLAQLCIDHGATDQVAYYAQHFTGLDKDIAQQLMEQNYATAAVLKADTFADVIVDDHLFQQAAMHGAAWWIYMNHPEQWKKIRMTDELRTALLRNETAFALEYADDFGIIRNQQLAEQLIEQGATERLANNIARFSGLNAETARILIRDGYAGSVIRHIDVFEGLVIDDALIDYIIQANGIDTLFHYYQYIPAHIFTPELAQKCIALHRVDIAIRYADALGIVVNPGFLFHLIREGRGAEVLDVLRRVQIDEQRVAQEIIERNGSRMVAENLEQFSGESLGADIVHRLIDDGYIAEVAKHAHIFQRSAFTPDVLFQCIERGYAQEVIGYFRKDERTQYLADWLIYTNQAETVVEGLRGYSVGFSHLSPETAAYLASIGHGDNVIMRSDVFDGPVCHQALVDTMIATGQGLAHIATSLDKFRYLTIDTAYRLIEAGHAQYVARHSEAFTVPQPLAFDDRLARALIQYHAISVFLADIQKFSDVSVDIAYTCIDRGYVDSVFKNARVFPQLVFDNDIAQGIIKTNIFFLGAYIQHFERLSDGIANELMHYYSGSVLSSIHSFAGLRLSTLLRCVASKGHQRGIDMRSIPPSVIAEEDRDAFMTMAIGSRELNFNTLSALSLSGDPFVQEEYISDAVKAWVRKGLKEEDVTRIVNAIVNSSEQKYSSEDRIQMDEQNWAELLVLRARMDLEDEEIVAVPPHIAEKVKATFEDSAAQEMCLAQCSAHWKEAIRCFPESQHAQFEILCGVIDSIGAGPYTQIESIAHLMMVMRANQHRIERYPKTQQRFQEGLQRLEVFFERNILSQDDHTYLRQVCASVIEMSPALCTDIVGVLESLSPQEFKEWVRKVLPTIQAYLAVCGSRKDNSPLSREGAEVLVYARNQIRALFRTDGNTFAQRIEKINTEIFNNIIAVFKEKFGIIRIPEQFGPEQTRSIMNFSLYSAHIAERSEKHTATIAWYLALHLHDKWTEYRAGVSIDPYAYLVPEYAEIVAEIIEESASKQPLTAELLGIEEGDLPRVRADLQTECTEATMAHVDTVDVQLYNIASAIANLADSDLYPEPLEKVRLQLLKDHEAKTVNQTIAKMVRAFLQPGELVVLNEEEQRIQESVRAALTQQGIEVNKESVAHHFQKEMKLMSTIVKLLHLLQKENVLNQVYQLRELLHPNPEVIAIFNRLGEAFSTHSGAMPLSQDLDYLEQLVMKRAQDLQEEDRDVLQRYIEAIREKLGTVEEVYARIVREFLAIERQLSDVQNQQLRGQVQEIVRAIQAQDQRHVVYSTAASNMNAVIENIRECLSCTRNGANNDTNLTFGDGNKFFVYSHGARREGRSIADQVVFLEPITIADPETGENKRCAAFVLDRIYGKRAPDILDNHIAVIVKKMRAVRIQHPEARLYVMITAAALQSVGVSPAAMNDIIRQRYGATIHRVDVGSARVDVAPSAAADHYIEFGLGPRTAGERQVEGIVLTLA